MSYRRVRAKPEFRSIPKGAQKIASKLSSAVVYFSGVPDRLMAVGFVGKAVKPSFHYRFRTVERRNDWVAEWIRSQDARAARKASEAAADAEKRKAGHPLKVGSILRSSWGYDQTNIDYYEVVELVGKCSVKIRELTGESVESGPLAHAGMCVPNPGGFKEGSEPMLKRVNVSEYGCSVKIYSFANAYLIEPKEVAPGVKVYPASSWSATH